MCNLHNLSTEASMLAKISPSLMVPLHWTLLFPVTKFTIWKEVLQVTAEWVICGSCADAQMHSLAEETELQRCRETVMLGQLQLDKQLLDYIMDCLALFLIRICHSAEKRWTITYKQKFFRCTFGSYWELGSRFSFSAARRKSLKLLLRNKKIPRIYLVE